MLEIPEFFIQLRTKIEKLKNPIYIVGFPRSGTTLLRSILSQHSLVCLINEPELLLALRQAGYRVDERIAVSKELIDALKKIGPCNRYLCCSNINDQSLLFKDNEHLYFKEIYERLLLQNGKEIRYVLAADENAKSLIFIINY